MLNLRQGSVGRQRRRPQGLAGGIGLHTTGITKRRFLPNLQTVRATAGKGNTKRMTVCARCIKAGKVVKATKAAKKK